MNRERPNRVAQLRSQKHFWRNFWRVMLQSIVWSGVAVLYYVIFSLLFDTPYEYYMRRSSESLEQEFLVLEARLDSLEMIIDDIEQRDNNVFNIMFDSSPCNPDPSYSNLDLRESLTSMDDRALSAALTQRSQGFTECAEALTNSTKSMLRAIDQQGKNRSKIPAIQPISNRQLTLLTASFGERMHPFYKTIQHHAGVDYTIPEGTRVVATADGTIKNFSLSSAPTGKSILIDHGNGYETFYAHLDKIDIPRSRRVKRGDIIGMSGNTGLSLTPHLHYEIRYNGKAVDPINYFFMELNPKESQQMARIAESGMQSFD